MRHDGRVAAAGMLVCGWGGNQFTPLLVMYRELGFSTITVDALLGAYVIGLVPGLLVAGRLSQRVGRRPVMVAGVAMSLLASLLLALGPFGVGWLAAGRLITGFGVAVAMSVGSTWVAELSVLAGDSQAEGARRAALWLTLGFGLGAGVAGVLAQWAPAPQVLAYLVHIALALAALCAVASLPETREPDCEEMGGRVAGLRHPRFLRVITPMAPWIFGSAGIAYAVMPQLVGDSLGRWGLAYSTLLTVATLGTGALIQPFAKRLDRVGSARGVLIGMVTMASGLAVASAVAVVRSPTLALLAAILLGAAYGIAIVSGLLELQRLAAPEELAPMVGVYYALAYSGFLLPSILAVLNTIASYTVMLLGLVAIAASGSLIILRHSRRDLPG